MKFYIAGSNQYECKQVAIALKASGHEIICSWLDVPFNRTSSHTIEERIEIATLDVSEITLADSLVILESPAKTPGGKFVEAGVALGQGKKVWLIGRRENMLMWHPNVKRVDSLDELVEVLS